MSPDQSYQAVIGLEIHAELKTQTKMFCRCLNDPFTAEPNTHICPVCLGLPGALPVANQAAVEATVMIGLALNCQIAGHSQWDRKHYFYPDLPKGYQISQYDQPLCQHGRLSLADGRTVQITRIHLEEDTGTLQHPAGQAYSLVNYNRAGVPLLELVTEPDLRTGQEARLLAEEYQRLLRALGIANADMEKGELRVEANISVRTAAQAAANQLGTKVEVKNLNSFRATEKAINYELDRQTELLKRGTAVVQETRGWHDLKQLTFSQRVKEGSADYRYFPEPDLPPLVLTADQLKAIKSRMPALPSQRRAHYLESGLTSAQAETLINNQALATYYDSVMTAGVAPQLVANWVINILNDQSLPPAQLQALLRPVQAGQLTNYQARQLLTQARASGQTIETVLAGRSANHTEPDDAALIEAVKAVLVAHPAVVASYRAGKPQVLGWLVGQVMAAVSGQAEPQQVAERLKAQLND